jgi:4-hydroxybenzoate-CoA ligase
MSGSYNAVTWLLDRNVDEGRGPNSLSPIPSPSSPMAICSGKAAGGQHAAPARRPPRRARGDDHARHRRLSCGFLGAIRAGIVPVPLNTLLTSDQYAYVLADCRARVLFISEALYPVVKDIVGRMPDLEHVVVSGSNAFGHKKLSDELARETDTFATVPTHAEEPLSGSIRPDRPACPRACGICIPACRRPRTPMQPGARHP